jgi:4-diphosphocytidyl-2-C-methyl-D-erythritol kinase
LEKISVKAPAKINLLLRVVRKRPDGYHDIESLMQAVDLYDEITFEKADSIEFSCSDPALPTGPDNLAVKAAQYLQAVFHFPGVRIELTKRIPSGAGLGGGSSDAAAVLRGLCRLFNLKPSPDELSDIAARIGSDVPFFLSTGQALIEGRGEIIHQIELPLDYNVVIVNPSMFISTADVYKKAKINLTKSGDDSLFKKKIDTSKLKWRASYFHNDLEEVVFAQFPALKEIKRTLSGAGAFYSSMTGSGSSFFGLFSPGSQKNDELERLKEQANVKVFFCRPILMQPYGS